MKLIWLLMLLAFFGCSDPRSWKEGGPVTLERDFWTFEVKGMPCVAVGRKRVGSSSVWAYDGVTCDWSKVNKLEWAQWKKEEDIKW